MKEEYYSITDVLRRFKIGRKEYHKLIKDKLLPVISSLVDYGNYKMNVIYIKKEIIDSLNLEIRKK